MSELWETKDRMERLRSRTQALSLELAGRLHHSAREAELVLGHVRPVLAAPRRVRSFLHDHPLLAPLVTLAAVVCGGTLAMLMRRREQRLLPLSQRVRLLRALSEHPERVRVRAPRWGGLVALTLTVAATAVLAGWWGARAER